jgi:hypothetical protein
LNKSFIQKLYDEATKDALLLSKMFQIMLNFERKFNQECEEENKKCASYATRKGT